MGDDVGFDTIVKTLHMALMGGFEARHDDWRFFADISYLSASVVATAPFGSFNTKLEDKTFFGTFAATYRFIDQQTFWVNTFGGRAW